MAMNTTLRELLARHLIVILVVAAASCSQDESQPNNGATNANRSTDASDSAQDDEPDLRNVDAQSEEHSEPETLTVMFNDTEYIFRFSEGGLYEFTPAGQEDLSRWVEMLSINLYADLMGEDALAEVANSVLATYTANGAQVERTDSVPRTEQSPAEHLIVVTFNIPGISESVRARFVLVGEECVGLIHSHRTYGASADEDIEAWLEGDGAGLDDKLMEWDDYPSVDELTALQASWQEHPALDEQTPGEADAIEPSAMPIYVTPLYDSEGPDINVGQFSDELEAASAETILEVATTMKEEWDTLPIEAMFVLAIRLYDFGHKDESVYWFYSAQMRFRVLHDILVEESVGSIGSSPFELLQASAAFMQLSGEYINGYGFGDLEKLRETLRLVMEEAETIPEFHSIYPDFELIDEEEWQVKRADVVANLQEMLDYIDQNEEFIREQRRINRVDERY